MSSPNDDRSHDLPVLAEAATPPAPLPSPTLAASGRPLVAVMSDLRREGPWPVPPRLTVTAVMGGIHLDFRDAVLPGGPVELRSTTVMADLTVIVPPGTRVHMEGLILMGDQKMHQSTAAPSAVQDTVLDLTIRANGMMADAKVYTLARGEQIPSWWRRKK